MPYESSYAVWARDKKAFFENLQNLNPNPNPNSDDFAWLTKVRAAAEQEFNDLFAALRANRSQNQNHWAYCHYCCTVLETYYLGYDQQSKADNYTKLKAKLYEASRSGMFREEARRRFSFLEWVWIQIREGVKELLSIPFHVSKMRKAVSLANLGRIYWLFCRLSLNNFIHAATEMRWIEKIDKVFKNHTDIDKALKVLNAPNPVMSAFGVAFFGVRLVLNLVSTLKHVLDPTPLEAGLSPWQRFCGEVKKRHCQGINDITWVTVNGVTNLMPLTGKLPGPVGTGITVAFLIFDFAFLVYQHRLARKAYEKKQDQYLREIAMLESRLARDAENQALQAQLALLHQQLTQLNMRWDAQSAGFFCNMGGAFLIAAGFSGAALFSPPVAALVCYFVCVVGAALYLSADECEAWRLKKLELDEAIRTGKGIDEAIEAYCEAKRIFIFTVSKNIIVPTLIIATFVVCWQAAIVLTVLYAGFELWNAWRKYQNSLPNEQGEADTDIDAALPIPG